MSTVFNGVQINELIHGNGVDTRVAVRAATTAAVDLSSDFDGAAVDGVTLTVGDRFLVKNQAALAEVTSIVTTGATPAGLDGTYFTLGSASGATYYVWFDTDAAGSDPAPGGGLVSLQVSIVTGDSDTDIATKLRTAIGLNVDFTSGGAGTTVTATDATTGPVADATDVDSGLAITTTTQGTSAIDNGIYQVLSSGAGGTFRAEDLITGDSADFVFVNVEEGTLYAKTQWTCTSLGGSAIVDTDPLTWTMNVNYNYAKGAIFYATSGTELATLAAPSDTSLLQIDTAGNVAWIDRADVAAGLDPKESVRVATRDGMDIGGVYAPGGTTEGGALTGAFTGVDLTDDSVFDLNGGATVLGIGDRVLIRSQTDAKENGIYVVTVAGAAGAIQRAADQDESVAGNVSAGNFTFVETGDTLDGTQWIVQGNGVLSLNTDDINWVLFGASTAYAAGDGIDITAGTVSADLKANGGLVIESGEIAVDLGASNITGTLAVGDGGTGTTSLADNVILLGNATSPIDDTTLANVMRRTLINTAAGLPSWANLVFANEIRDQNDNALLLLATTASAVNELTITNAATGTNPELAATGDNTNIGIDLQTKGTGTFNFLSTADTAAEIRLFEDTDDGSNYVGLKAGTIGTSLTFTLPVADGSSGDVMITDGLGNLSFTDLDASERRSYMWIPQQITAKKTSLTAVGYFAWDDSEYGSYTSGKIVYEVDYSNRTLEIEVYNETTATSLGSTTHAADGFFSLAFTLPTADARLSLRVRKVGGGGSSPRVYGVQIEFNT